jgi:hypothetical protein
MPVVYKNNMGIFMGNGQMFHHLTYSGVFGIFHFFDIETPLTE